MSLIYNSSTWKRKPKNRVGAGLRPRAHPIFRQTSIMESPKPSKTAPELQHSLVEYLKQGGHLPSPSVEAAFRAVPRHLFLPDLELEKVYQDEAIPTKLQDEIPISSSSQPTIMAIMLEQLRLKPGQRVLEIGAGTGYNAALIAHIV